MRLSFPVTYRPLDGFGGPLYGRRYGKGEEEKEKGREGGRGKGECALDAGMPQLAQFLLQSAVLTISANTSKHRTFNGKAEMY